MNSEYNEQLEKYNHWLDETVERVVSRMNDRIFQHELAPQAGTSVPTIEGQDKKFQEVEQMIGEHYAHEGKKKGSLARIIRGYLTEFIRQSEKQTVACNILHDRNPDAKKYWDARPSEFREAIASGMYHSAVSYRKLVRDKFASSNERINRSPVFHSLGEIIRDTIDVFKEEYPKLNPDNPPVATLYNDHMAVVKLATDMDDVLGWTVKKAINYKTVF
jgi:hypothetical protein